MIFLPFLKVFSIRSLLLLSSTCSYSSTTYSCVEKRCLTDPWMSHSPLSNWGQYSLQHSIVSMYFFPYDQAPWSWKGGGRRRGKGRKKRKKNKEGTGARGRGRRKRKGKEELVVEGSLSSGRRNFKFCFSTHTSLFLPEASPQQIELHWPQYTHQARDVWWQHQAWNSCSRGTEEMRRKNPWHNYFCLFIWMCTCRYLHVY